MIRIFNQDVSPKGLLLFVTEAVIIASALPCGVRLRFWNSPVDYASYMQFPDFAWQALAFVLTFQVCFYYGDLYDLSALRHRGYHLICLGQSLGAACLILGLLYYLAPGLLIGRGIFFISVGLVVLFVSMDRLLLDAIWHLAAPLENIIILGTDELAVTAARELTRREDLNVRFVGFVEPYNRRGQCGDMLFGHPVLTADLQTIVASRHVSRIVVAMGDRRGGLPTGELVKLRVQGVRVEDVHSTIAFLTGRVWLSTVRPSWFLFSDGFHRSRTTLILKRILDLSCAIVGLLFSLPVMVLVAAAIRLDSSGPILYRQSRMGLGGKSFDVLKFRSMRSDAENGCGAQWAIENDPRVTRVGRIIRKYRLDELPQFVNVIRGEMSFVGPRPERPEFVEELRREISYYDQRHTVRPGLTGWAQVQYRYGSSVDDARRKLEYDLFYLKNMSVFFDFLIVLKTVRIVLTGFGSR